MNEWFKRDGQPTAFRRPHDQRDPADEGARARGQGSAPGQRVPEAGGLVFRTGEAGPPAEVLRDFIDTHRNALEVEPIRKVLQVAPSGYRRQAALVRKPHERCARAQRDGALIPAKQLVWQTNMQV